MKTKRIISIVFGWLLLPFCLFSQVQQVVKSVPQKILTKESGATVYFHVGKSKLDSSFRRNQVSMDSVIEELRQLPDSLELKKIYIISGASPEGGYNLNRRLATRRGEVLRVYLSQILSLKDLTFEVVSEGEEWRRLYDLVAHSPVECRDEVLSIIKEEPIEPAPNREDLRTQRLRKLCGGRPWKYMSRNFFGELRSATIVKYEVGVVKAKEVITPDPMVIEETIPEKDTPKPMVIEETILEKDTPKPMVTEETIPEKDTPKPMVIEETIPEKDTPKPMVTEETIPEKDTVIVEAAVRDSMVMVMKEREDPTFISLKTNLLYDLALIPNIELEYLFADGWTIGGTYHHAWWHSDRKHRYWRTYGGEVNLRHYFGKQAAQKPMTGHHGGVYAQMLSYDFELGGRGYLSHFSYGGGVEYGYSLPLASRFSLDFSLGLGYLGGSYKVYDPTPVCYAWRETRQRHWFGPTKGEVTLVWHLSNGYKGAGRNSIKK